MPESFFQPRPQDEIDALAKEKTTFIGGKSLEGQFDDNNSKGQGENQEARMAFAMNRLATGKVLPTLWPSHPHDLEKIDPLLNVSEKWPPTAIVHGNADTMIPMRLSKIFESKLREKGVEVEFIEIEGEPHTFCGKMEKGSRTWDTQRKGFDFLEKVLERSYT
jgi:acetyl esterase/lipase